ncbi:MAG TPA: hypothetical protein PLL10_11640, partial [Elusimicrobiales bacterium]|nr:hypothetical protein [Elusimicrobiales bacterium]
PGLSATLSSLISVGFVYLLMWRLYQLALTRFCPAPSAAQSAESGASAHAQPWSAKKTAAVMAALHPVLLHLFTVVAYLIFAQR